MGINQRWEFNGIEALRIGRYGRKINTTCFLYRIGGTVIDTGPPNQWRKVRAFLNENPVKRVLITHHHEDHGGNGARIQNQLKAALYAHEHGVALHGNGFHVPFYRRLVWGKPGGRFTPEVLPETVEMENGFSLKPLHSPGHAVDQVCFLEPNRGWLFTGDLYVSCKPKYLRGEEDPNLEIQSLRDILSQDFDTVFCSHQGRLEKGRQALKAKLNYLISLREQVRHYRRIGDSIAEIKKRLMGREAFLYWFSGGEFSKRNYIKAFAFPKPEPSADLEPLPESD